MQEGIKSRLNSGNACYHSVHSLLSTRLLSRNVKVKTYCNVLGFYFTMEVYYTPKFNTQLLITVHNSSRILTHV
jgi:hypothetical protein